MGGFVFFLILGIGIGYVSFDKSDIINENQTELNSTQTSLSSLQTKYDELETQFNKSLDDYLSLETEYTVLSNQLDNLNTNTVNKSEYDAINSQLITITSEKENLESELSLLQNQYDELTSQFQELSAIHEELLDDYELLNSPQSKFTTLSDLEITLTTDKTVYSYTDSISGNVSIYYKTGEPYEGSFELNMQWEGANTGLGLFNINGDKSYSIMSPKSFPVGPDYYTITVAWLKDKDGYYVHTGRIDSTAIILEAK